MRMVLGISGTCWPPWRMSTTATRIKEYIKKLNNIFFCHLIHHLYLFFSVKTNANGYRYLRDMLANMEDVDDGDQKEYIKKYINIFFVHVYIIYTYYFKGNRM